MLTNLLRTELKLSSEQASKDFKDCCRWLDHETIEKALALAEMYSVFIRLLLASTEAGRYSDQVKKN